MGVAGLAPGRGLRPAADPPAVRPLVRRRQPPQQPPPQQPPPPPPAGAAAPPPDAVPVTATVESSFTVSSWPCGQTAGAFAWDMGRRSSKVAPQERQRKS